MSKKVFITDSKRTAITNFGGTLRDLSPVEIGVQCLEKILIDTPELKSKTDMVVIGNVLSAGHGQNIARQVAIKAGINQEIPAFTINHVCGSSMQAIITGMNYIQAGNADIVIAGGTESMSSAAFAMPNYRWENKMGHSIVASFAVKPTSSILTSRNTIDKKGKNTKISVKGRHDPCVGIRAVPIGEAMMNCVLLDHYLMDKAQCG